MKTKRALLDEQFRDGVVPTSEILLEASATWTIKMLTGPILDLSGWPTRHRKVFTRNEFKVLGGCNVCFRGLSWGHFAVYRTRWSGDDGQAMMFDYDMSTQNGFLTRRIVDLVRTTNDPNVLIGRFNYSPPRENDDFIFLGYFSMTRIGDK